jgi:L-fuconolactonase
MPGNDRLPIVAVSATTLTYAPYRDAWLARREEAVLEPELPIIDSHHHVWDAPRPRYMAGELIADVGCGHNILATVYVDCRSMYRASAPEHFRPLGEVEFANGLAAMGESGDYGSTRICAAIVSHVDLRHPEAGAVLDAMVAAGGGRFRGIRQASAWDPDPEVISPSALKPRDLLYQPEFRRGLAALTARGLSFDAFMYHHQLLDLEALAKAFPNTQLVLNHVGCPIGIGGYASKRLEVFQQWRENICRLGQCPNVTVKLGGLGMRMFGFGFETLEEPPSSEQLAASWQPYIETCIEAFGAGRAMFESNFPPDKASCSYRTLWNAFKRCCAGASSDEKTALFSGTARHIYRLP